MGIEVIIEGVFDARLANAIKQKIRGVGKAASRSDEWSVMLAPSETRGQWDLGVRGPSGRYFVSFTESADRLPELVAEQVRSRIAAAAERPLQFGKLH